MTTGNFSKAPGDVLANALSKGYAGVHIEQGVPVLDRDLNLLGDIITAALRQALQLHVGDGCAGLLDLAIAATPDPLNFSINPGTYLIGGVSVTLAAPTTYNAQIAPRTAAQPPPLTQPSAGQPIPRIDTVYLDMWVDELDDTSDSGLGNPSDVGMRTSTRSLPQFVIRVAENAGAAPAPIAGHVYALLAQISRPAAGGAPVITDLRRSRLTLAGAVTRLTTIETALSPSIFAVAPNDVIPGQSNSIVITGRNLDLGGAIVMLGPSTGVVALPTKPDALIVGIPADAQPGTWPLTVQTAIGTAVAPVPIKVESPPPKPSFAPLGGPLKPIDPPHAKVGDLLTLNGSKFSGVTQVVFNSSPPAIATSPGDIVSVTDAVIQVKVPAALSGAIGSPMTIAVTVDGTAATTGTSDPSAPFKVDPQPIPRPKWGPIGGQIVAPPSPTRGTVITLNGQNFGSSATTTSVQFNGVAVVTALASDMQTVTPTKITVKIPAALVVPPAPNNKCTIVVVVQGAQPSLESNDVLTVT